MKHMFFALGASMLILSSCSKDELKSTENNPPMDMSWTMAHTNDRAASNEVVLNINANETVQVADGNLNFQSVKVSNQGNTAIKLCLVKPNDQVGEEVAVEGGETTMVRMIDYDHVNVRKLCIKNAINDQKTVKVAIFENPFEEDGLKHNKLLDEIAQLGSFNELQVTDLVNFVHSNGLDANAYPESYFNDRLGKDPGTVMVQTINGSNMSNRSKNALLYINNKVSNANDPVQLLKKLDAKQHGIIQQYLNANSDKADLEIVLGTYSVARNSLEYWTKAYNDQGNPWHSKVNQLAHDLNGNGTVEPAEGPIAGFFADLIFYLAERDDGATRKDAILVAGMFSAAATALPTA